MSQLRWLSQRGHRKPQCLEDPVGGAVFLVTPEWAWFCTLLSFTIIVLRFTKTCAELRTAVMFGLDRFVGSRNAGAPRAVRIEEAAEALEASVAHAHAFPSISIYQHLEASTHAARCCKLRRSITAFTPQSSDPSKTSVAVFLSSGLSSVCPEAIHSCSLILGFHPDQAAAPVE